MVIHYEKTRNKCDSGVITAVLAVFLIISVEYYAYFFAFSNHLLKIVTYYLSPCF